jgi:sensor histidine kinase YesM
MSAKPLEMTIEERLEQEVMARSQHFHPLEVIPWFRKFPYSFGRDFLYTFIWNTLLGIVFFMIAAMVSGRISWLTFEINFVVANLIGYSIHFLFLLCSRTPIEAQVLSRGKWSAVAYYTIISTMGVIAGIAMASPIFGWSFSGWLSRPGWYVSVALNSFIISMIIGVVYFWRERSLLAEMRLARESEHLATVEREAMLANLRALQAQIEPHFLFNTLANVVGLIHPSPDTAKHMLEQFIAYLRASLTSSREQNTTLQQEFELMKHFLAILQIRMGERLSWQVDLPAEIASTPLPSMLLQPLVENAIKHGLEPKVEGGSVLLQARREADALRISVIDTGLGFTGATSSGIGLKNVRERLDKLYDGKAKLSIEENSPSGTRVIITLPTAG